MHGRMLNYVCRQGVTMVVEVVEICIHIRIQYVDMAQLEDKEMELVGSRGGQQWVSKTGGTR